MLHCDCIYQRGAKVITFCLLVRFVSNKSSFVFPHTTLLPQVLYSVSSFICYLVLSINRLFVGKLKLVDLL